MPGRGKNSFLVFIRLQNPQISLDYLQIFTAKTPSTQRIGSRYKYNHQIWFEGRSQSRRYQCEVFSRLAVLNNLAGC
jgi:hypothetical protein